VVFSVADYVEGVLAADRTWLGRAITLVESSQPAHQDLAQEVLQELLVHAGNSQRVGITGVPGVGKSTFIDSLGTRLTGDGHNVAVLAVDPSSSITGGSILADKTRMARLAVDPNAFIRPSPASGALGGVARRTRETIIVAEAAGFDVVLVETVGVGQSETVVVGMVDFFLVLMLPGAGDELQGIKKGVLEVADMIAVNKSDGDNLVKAREAVRDYSAALRLTMAVSPNWQPPVVMCSGLHESGLEELWVEVERHRVLLSESGELSERRQRQQVTWMWEMLEEQLIAGLRADPAVAKVLTDIEAQVESGSLNPPLAVERILGEFRR
jgi:LAO/AO transport system kinase